MTSSIVVGGSNGIGRFIAQRFADRGDDVVITSRSAVTANEVALAIGGATRGIELDLSHPTAIAEALVSITSVDNLVVTAIEQSFNALTEFDIEGAIRLATIKLVGYTETVRALHPRFAPGASVVLFGGVAKERPYPGSTMVTTVNGGVSALVRTLTNELKPHRINVLHPGVVGDSPKWINVSDHPHLSRTPIGRLVIMEEIADATDFLLNNAGINGQDLVVDGGLLAT